MLIIIAGGKNNNDTSFMKAPEFSDGTGIL
jgi:hypothetical protein